MDQYLPLRLMFKTSRKFPSAAVELCARGIFTDPVALFWWYCTTFVLYSWNSLRSSIIVFVQSSYFSFWTTTLHMRKWFSVIRKHYNYSAMASTNCIVKQMLMTHDFIPIIGILSYFKAKPVEILIKHSIEMLLDAFSHVHRKFFYKVNAALLISNQCFITKLSKATFKKNICIFNKRNSTVVV